MTLQSVLKAFLADYHSSQAWEVSVLQLRTLGSATWRLVLLSENGELKKPLTMFMTDSVTHLSRKVSACFRSVVVLQTWVESLAVT